MYRNIALMSVSLFYRRKLLLTNKTYSITHTPTKPNAPHHIHSCTCFVYFQSHNLKEILNGSTRETVSTVPFFFFYFSNSVYICFTTLTQYWKIIISIAMFFPFMELFSIQFLVTKKWCSKSSPCTIFHVF